MIGKFLSILLVIVLTNFTNVNAQTVRNDKLYTVSGIGTSIPIGNSSDIFKSKICTTLGVNLGIGNGGAFLFPKFNLHAFSYSAINPDHKNKQSVLSGRASTYLLNLNFGYRKQWKKLAAYAFGGGGGGFVLTPTATINSMQQQVTLQNKSHGMLLAEAGIGAELNLGGLSVFAESSYMNGFNKIQNRYFTTVPITFGIKPNLSKLFKPKS